MKNTTEQEKLQVFELECKYAHGEIYTFEIQALNLREALEFFADNTPDDAFTLESVSLRIK